MLLSLILEFLGEVALVQTGVAAVGVYAIGDYATKDDIVLCKNYENEPIIWEWGDDPDLFNFQDFIGLSVSEVKQIIPDIQDKQHKFLRTLDYYELNLIFNSQGLCASVEYLRPKDPNWPYKYNGKFPLENTYTESKILKYKSNITYPVYIYRRESLATPDAIICYAEARKPETSISNY